ncbi:polysaccharide export protein [Burkholderiales bacterium GJ-E10]|nr:polysaccharide export protein [Burkholderiales bacterium GJ-E10]
MNPFFRILAAATATTLVLGGCSHFITNAGPSTSTIESEPQAKSTLRGIRLFHVDYALAHAVETRETRQRFSAFFSGPAHPNHVVGPGDVLAIFLWESPPAMLFTAQSLAVGSAGMAGGGTGMVSLPVQTVDNAGQVVVPFVGSIPVAGKTLSQIEHDIVAKLSGMANHPQAIVELAVNNTQNITVVGNVPHSLEVPLTPGGVRLLRAIALAGGVTQAVETVSIQLSRAGRVMTMPLQAVLRDPRENIPLRAGDVVTALYQPSSFSVLGATGRNSEVNFKASGITLAQAIARAGGLDDNRANPSAVFLFRFAAPDSLPPRLLRGDRLVDGKVPAIFEFDLRDPAVFFAAQTFPIHDHDLLYVSDAPANDLQKVLTIVGSIVFPYQAYTTSGGTIP